MDRRESKTFVQIKDVHACVRVHVCVCSYVHSYSGEGVWEQRNIICQLYLNKPRGKMKKRQLRKKAKKTGDLGGGFQKAKVDP